MAHDSFYIDPENKFDTLRELIAMLRDPEVKNYKIRQLRPRENPQIRFAFENSSGGVSRDRTFTVREVQYQEEGFIDVILE